MVSASRCFLASALLLNFTLANAAAQSLDQAASQLAARIAAVVPAKTGLALGVENLSSLPTPEVAKVRDVIQSELMRAGLQFDSNSPTLIQVTISENARGFLLIAQTPSPDGTKVSMFPWVVQQMHPAVARSVITKTLVMEHPSPILDIAVTNDGAELWLLEPARLLHFTKNAGAWTRDRDTTIPLTRPPPRDARGRLTPDPRLPDSSAAWQLDARHSVRWATGRNFFMDEPAGFYSVASIGGFEFKTGLDGRARMNTSSGQLIANIDDWGSDIAAIQGSCGQPFLIASSKTEREGLDSLQAYQLIDAKLVPSRESLSLPGPVTALWPSETPAQVTAVVHNRQTGNYEAYRVAIACGN
jgi:hypothetical protein